MSLLETIQGPDDLKRVPPGDLPRLAAEIRDFLVAAVCRTGGHLGPNLGAVELTLALHRVFDSPRDRILWDTGHQAYVHKLLTGRRDGFTGLRQAGGLSGYPNRAESEHDLIENSHASTALSYADGLAKAYQLRGESDRAVVAVVGDGALTGGMCWEALNNIAAGSRPVVVVVNDNGRSYAPTVGGLAEHLGALRLTQGYEQALDVVKTVLSRTRVVGPPLYEALHGIKKGIKDVLAPQGLFEDLGLKYVGPIDGHDVESVEHALRLARDFGGPVIVHCVTRKGFGYGPAEADVADCLHGVAVLDPATGQPVSQPEPDWTSVFGQEILAIAAERPDVVAITAAMLQPVGLEPMRAAYPERVFDVGIAEQHAVTSAAGLALGGMHPVVCVYATFLNRAFDQLLMDVALHHLPVTVVLDRSGITGPDGPSHHGMWDLAALSMVPGLRVAAPRDAATLRGELREAVVQPGPTVLRYSKGAVGTDIPTVRRIGGMDLVAGTGRGDVLVVAVGAMARTGLDVGSRLAAQGITASVVDPRWVLPVDPALPALAADHRFVVVVEDGVRSSGVGVAVAQAVHDAGVTVPVRAVGLPREFLPQGSRGELLAQLGLTGQDIARDVVELVASQEAATPVAPAEGAEAAGTAPPRRPDGSLG
jgi:1-deoxy-D-xylulose-5-phosphate synthase